MANPWGVGFVGTLTAHLNQALQQVQEQQVMEQARKQKIANLMIQHGMDQGGQEGARMMAAGYTVLLDPKAKIEEPEKSKAWQQAAGIAHLTTQMQEDQAAQQGPKPAPAPTIGKPPEAAAPVDLSAILGQNSSQQPQSQQPPPGPPGALPSTSPTTGGPPLNLTPGAPPTAPPSASPPPGAATPGPAGAAAAPQAMGGKDPGWQAMREQINRHVEQARNALLPHTSFVEVSQNAGKMLAQVNSYEATGKPFNEDTMDEILSSINPTAARIGATQSAAGEKRAHDLKMQGLRQTGAMALEAAKEAFQKGAAQVQLDDAQAQALGLPEAGFVDRDVMKQLAANHRASEAAGARVRAASTSAGTGIVKVVDDTGNTVYMLKGDAVGRQAPLAAGMEQTVSRAEAGLQASKEIRQQLQKPKVKAGLGAIAGRVSTMGQFIGGAAISPELAELQTALKGYILAAYGVHGLRNAKEANHDYESFLAMKYSPQNISAALDGYDVILRGFAQHRPTPPGSATGTGSKVKPPPGATDKKADPLGIFQ